MAHIPPQGRLVVARLLITGIGIVFRNVWTGWVSGYKATPSHLRCDLSFLAGAFVVALVSVVVLLATYPEGNFGQHTTPIFATASAGLFWAAAGLLCKTLPLSFPKAHIAVWMFVPLAPVFCMALGWLAGHQQDLLFPMAFLPAGALLAIVCALNLAQGMRSVADRLVHTSLSAMSAHQRLALLAHTNKEPHNRPRQTP